MIGWMVAACVLVNIGMWMERYIVIIPTEKRPRLLYELVQGKYTQVGQLPEQSGEVSVVTDIWFKIEGVPAKYDKMLLQVDLYRKTDSGWSEFRVATSDRPVYGKGSLWQHSLRLTAPRSSKWATEIESKNFPPGRYFVKLYIDQAATGLHRRAWRG